MYLKGVELYGFKSFADRTELVFNSGVTAVVGPNGSGKSNISDSIRWVLGEQSAKSLRGAKMEDVIFSGSETRKPVNYSEVILTLDNTDRTLALDYSEITITRRVYRTGESEYLLNKQPCRLKDITELLMDTGLGKEAYSIIGQGRIDEILSTKSTDRRGVFEEAAGVIKYKNRKKEAERKLEDTSANLVRITDIIHELEEQIEPLRVQSQKAEQFLSLKEQLKENEITLYVHKIENLHEAWQKSKLEQQKLQALVEQSTVEMSQTDAEFERQRWSLNQHEQMLEEAQKKMLALTEELEKSEGQREVLRERHKNYTHNQQQLHNQLNMLAERLEHIQSELAKEVERSAELKRASQQLEQQKEEYTQGLLLDKPELEQRIEQLKAEYIDHLNAGASLQNEIRHLEQSSKQFTYKVEQLHTDLLLLQEQRQELSDQVTAQENLVSSQEKKLDDLRAEFIQTEQRHQFMLKKIQDGEETYRQALSQLEQHQARLTFLKEMKEGFTGFFEGVKAVLKARGHQLQGIEGAVAELISVPKKLEVAIETALGSALQHIVVDDEENGRKAIEFLKHRRLGRATFLPRAVLKPRMLPASDLSSLQSAAGFIGVASNLISFEERYANVIGNLLGSVIITADLRAANQMAKALHHKYRFVTLDGDIVNPGGSMTGGSRNKKQTHLLGREREIDELSKQIVAATHKTEQAQQALHHDKTEIAQLDAQLKHIRAQAESVQVEEQNHKERRAQLLFDQNRVAEKIELLEQDIQAYTAQHEQAVREHQNMQDKLREQESISSQIQNDIHELEQQRKDFESNRSVKQDELTQLKVQLAKKIQEAESVNEHIHRLQQDQAATNEQLRDYRQEYASLEKKVQTQDEDEQEVELRIEQKKAEKDEHTALVEQYREQRKQMHQELEALQIEMKQQRKIEQQTNAAFHKMEVQVNRLDVELENYLTLLREDYELSYELAKEQYPPPEHMEEVVQQVEQLKADIARLGPVNTGAIEQFERVSERYDFLHKQEHDLRQAKQKLYDVIVEMDAEMSLRFKTTFDLVREQFSSVFQQLFGGGRADLILSDPEDLLETGVDIVAQPPGKKLQHLGLLSGGERALTALALLFAILKVKPVPFCVLDEVEAALDEANVMRFSEYLRSFAHDTQFIVITHRKGTMEGADVLYGITMQESGVSKLVSVKLEEAEDIITSVS